MKTNPLLPLFFCLLFFACKKEETPEEKAIRIKKESIATCDSLNTTVISPTFSKLGAGEQTKTIMLSINKMKEFIKNNPEDSLSPLYMFNVAQLFNQLLLDEQTGMGYLDRLQSEYPKHQRSADALWQLALHYERNGNKQVAISYLKELQIRFPEHSLSKEAGIYLEKYFGKSDEEIIKELKNQNGTEIQ